MDFKDLLASVLHRTYGPSRYSLSPLWITTPAASGTEGRQLHFQLLSLNPDEGKPSFPTLLQNAFDSARHQAVRCAAAHAWSSSITRCHLRVHLLGPHQGILSTLCRRLVPPVRSLRCEQSLFDKPPRPDWGGLVPAASTSYQIVPHHYSLEVVRLWRATCTHPSSVTSRVCGKRRKCDSWIYA